MEILLLISLLLIDIVVGYLIYLVVRYFVIEEEVGIFTKGIVVALLINLVVYSIQMNIEILKLI